MPTESPKYLEFFVKRFGVFATFIYATALVFVLAASRPALATPPPEECYRAARYASHETTVPLNVLLAIARTETGRQIDNRIQPWPWAINFEGRGEWLASEAELLETALGLIADGERLFDVGCFQLNYRWHGAEFSSLDEMISPRANALYAAKFLKTLFNEFGDWTKAVGAYHSRTEALAASYTAKFLTHYDENEEPLRLAMQHSTKPKATRRNSYPLLIAKPQKAQLGSLVPRSSN